MENEMQGSACGHENQPATLRSNQGSFLPPISTRRKAPEVGLFGDYVDGQDAMLVYDVDSDAEDYGKVVQKKKKNPKTTKKSASTPVVERDQFLAVPGTERNVVVPDESNSQS